MKQTETEKGKGDSDLAAAMEEEADSRNASIQPDWEEIAAVKAEAAVRREAGTLTAEALKALRERAAEAIPDNRPELLAEIETALTS